MAKAHTQKILQSRGRRYRESSWGVESFGKFGDGGANDSADVVVKMRQQLLLLSYRKLDRLKLKDRPLQEPRRPRKRVAGMPRPQLLKRPRNWRCLEDAGVRSAKKNAQQNAIWFDAEHRKRPQASAQDTELEEPAAKKPRRSTGTANQLSLSQPSRPATRGQSLRSTPRAKKSNQSKSIARVVTSTSTSVHENVKHPQVQPPTRDNDDDGLEDEEEPYEDELDDDDKHDKEDVDASDVDAPEEDEDELDALEGNIDGMKRALQKSMPKWIDDGAEGHDHHGDDNDNRDPDAEDNAEHGDDEANPEPEHDEPEDPDDSDNGHSNDGPVGDGEDVPMDVDEEPEVDDQRKAKTGKVSRRVEKLRHEEPGFINNRGQSPLASNASRQPADTHNRSRVSQTASVQQEDPVTALVWTSNNNIAKLRMHPRFQLVFDKTVDYIKDILYRVDSFPDGGESDKAAFFRDALWICARQDQCKPILRRIKHDSEWLRAVSRMLEIRMCIIRSKVKTITARKVPGHYGLKPDDPSLDERIRRLLDESNYIFPGDVMNGGVDAQRAYEHPIFVDVYREVLFIGRPPFIRGRAHKFLSTDGRRHEIPSALTALVATSVVATLIDIQNQVSKLSDFTADEWYDTYKAHVIVLEDLQQEYPDKWSDIMAKQFEKASSGHSLDTAKAMAADIKRRIDLSGLVGGR
ncbi:hypothetical protein K474DRAFT_1680783 [Panus rudis PR-1116 ss-1]|nr:hypothetical protein K474DRAFT_1680783 [Panus rudis PR-1116 ss-1]